MRVSRRSVLAVALVIIASIGSYSASADQTTTSSTRGQVSHFVKLSFNQVVCPAPISSVAYQLVQRTEWWTRPAGVTNKVAASPRPHWKGGIIGSKKRCTDEIIAFSDEGFNSNIGFGGTSQTPKTSWLFVDPTKGPFPYARFLSEYTAVGAWAASRVVRSDGTLIGDTCVLQYFFGQPGGCPFP